MVEVEKGGMEAACSTPPKAGMVIRTNTERLRKYRKNILELLLVQPLPRLHHLRQQCGKLQVCRNWPMRFGITGEIRFPSTV
jgi:NADH-quinone oxidoreductase subunit G